MVEGGPLHIGFLAAYSFDISEHDPIDIFKNRIIGLSPVSDDRPYDVNQHEILYAWILFKRKDVIFNESTKSFHLRQEIDRSFLRMPRIIFLFNENQNSDEGSFFYTKEHRYKLVSGIVSSKTLRLNNNKIMLPAKFELGIQKTLYLRNRAFSHEYSSERTDRIRQLEVFVLEQ